jgi:hypothetical protein
MMVLLSLTVVEKRFLQAQKKTDVSEHPAVFDHVGLLVNRPTGTAGLPFT